MKPLTIKYATRCRKCERPVEKGEVAWGEINELTHGWNFECDLCYGEIAKEAKTRKHRKVANDLNFSGPELTLGNENDLYEKYADLVEPVRKTWLETVIDNAEWRLRDGKWIENGRQSASAEENSGFGGA